jgi:muconolactone delta-isomerase
MRISIQIKNMGNGYRKAIFGQTRDRETGEYHVDSVFGIDDEQLLLRLRARLPELKTAKGVANLPKELRHGNTRHN